MSVMRQQAQLIIALAAAAWMLVMNLVPGDVGEGVLVALLFAPTLAPLVMRQGRRAWWVIPLLWVAIVLLPGAWGLAALVFGTWASTALAAAASSWPENALVVFSDLTYLHTEAT